MTGRFVSVLSCLFKVPYPCHHGYFEVELETLTRTVETLTRIRHGDSGTGRVDVAIFAADDAMRVENDPLNLDQLDAGVYDSVDIVQEAKLRANDGTAIKLYMPVCSDLHMGTSRRLRVRVRGLSLVDCG